MPMAMTGSKGAAGVGRGGHAGLRMQRFAVARQAIWGGRGALDEHAAAKRRRVGAREMPPESGSGHPAPGPNLQSGDAGICQQVRSACLWQARGSTQHKNRYLKLDRVGRRGPSAARPRLPHRHLPRWRVRTRARAYESEDSLFRARASEQIASWCLRVGMLMKLRASSSSIRCCGVALNDCSPPWMPSKK
jgi:hypothetical protein